jgi:hypothetical protein
MEGGGTLMMWKKDAERIGIKLDIRRMEEEIEIVECPPKPAAAQGLLLPLLLLPPFIMTADSLPSNMCAYCCKKKRAIGGKGINGIGRMWVKGEKCRRKKHNCCPSAAAQIFVHPTE